MTSLMKAFSIRLFILMCIFTFACGVSTIVISPPLSQTTWVKNYVGSLYTVSFDNNASPITWQWRIEQPGMTEVLLNSSTSQCTNFTSSTNGLSASCARGKETTLVTDQPLLTGTKITMIATGTTFSVQLSAQLNFKECQTDRNFSQLLIPTASCGYNCTVTYQCKQGYTSTLTDPYNARCNNFGTLEPSDQCILLPDVDDDGLLLPVWAIAVISVVGVILLVAGGVLIWRRCRN